MKNNSKIALGVILILFGIGSLLTTFNFMNDNIILLLISIGFFTLYFFKGGNSNYANIGFIIPAAILLAIAPQDFIVEKFSAERYNGELMTLSLGLAFFLIYFIHSIWIKDFKGKRRHWPLLVALVLLAMSAVNYASDAYNVKVLDYLRNFGWGVLLIGIGVYLLVRELIKKKA
jgi:hypothetical protein